MRSTWRTGLGILALLTAISGCATPTASPTAPSVTQVGPSAGSLGSRVPASSATATADRPRTTVGSTLPPAVLGSVDISSGLSCPTTFPAAKAKVPVITPAATADRLVPDIPLTSGLLCSYAGSNMAPMAGRPIGAQKVLAGDLTTLQSDLRWQPPNSGFGACSSVGGPQTNFLLALRPNAGPPLWVFAALDPNNCEPTTNGRFVSLDRSGMQFAASLAAGRWMPAPPRENASRCDAAGRFGQQDELVPPGVTAVRICVTIANTDTEKTVRITDAARLQPLLDAADRTKIGPTTGSCAQAVDTKTGQSLMPTFFTVAFDYATGPSVRLSVADGCRPGLDNGNLQSSDTAPVSAAVKKLLG